MRNWEIHYLFEKREKNWKSSPELERDVTSLEQSSALCSGVSSTGLFVCLRLILTLM